MNINSNILGLAILLTQFSCQQNQSIQRVDQLLALRDSLRQAYAPDRRVARFDIDIEYENGRLNLSGESDQLEAVAVLLNNLPVADVEDNIRRLPDESAHSYPYAIVNNSVSNLRTQPRHSAELTSQALLGTVLKVLKITEEWYLVQTPDDYIAWIDHGGVALKTKKQIADWRNVDKVIITEVNATIYGINDKTEVISDAVLGNMVEKVETQDQFVVVRLPDGRMGNLLKGSVNNYVQWVSKLNPSGALVEKYARQLMGAPYLWGGTSAKGMDCSGFTKTVYFMNGLIIPRDASQQINAGRVVDENLTFNALEKGDLLFFGKPATDSTKQRTTHVGLWLGNGEFIHASKQVRISSIDPASANYDEFNKNRYLGSRRYLKNIKGNITNLRNRLTLK